MNAPEPDFLAELRSLLDALCEETITPEQSQRLEELVMAHPAAEAYYVQRMAFQADLIQHLRPLSSEDEVPNAREVLPITAPAPAAGGSAPTSPRRRWRRWVVGGLSALAAGLLLAVVWSPRPAKVEMAEGKAEAIDYSVAVLVQALGAEWEGRGAALRPGAALSPGWLRLKSGTAQLEFYNGAMVILEGPAEFMLISRTEGYCAHGKLRALVPPQATGFTIGSPKLQVVDRGTEFGLQVGVGGKTEVHCFQGKVELHNADSAAKGAVAQELITGQSVRLDEKDKVRRIKANPGAFPTAQELSERVRNEVQRRRDAWLAGSLELRKDPDLLVYYTFENDEAWSRTLRDQARQRLQPRDGAIVGCSWVTGRWPGKQGLEFKRVSDRVLINVPGEYDALTLAAWVRVETLQNRNNSLMMADGWEPGGPHWQIGDDGMLILGVQTRPKKGSHYHAQEVFTPDQFGQWIHLAVVYDRGGRTVTHYVDGRPAAQVPLQFDIPLTVGDAELGNWNVGSHRNNTPVRNFNGCMDEFMMFARALSQQDIERLYTQGQPPR